MKLRVSPNDHKSYRYITLENGLRIFLIEDIKATLSAAALTINMGNFDDPQNREGMAHFLEHMLFLGTKKYPQQGDFQEFISLHGGNNNAWTDCEYSSYFFDIQPQFLSEALDRFSQFFIAPTFQADAVDKERHAIDNEYRLKLKDDNRRIYQARKESLNPAHPFTRFSVGNLDTLADRKTSNIRDELIAFYQQHVSAHLMTLVVQGPESLDQLESWVKTYFSSIPKTQHNKTPITEPIARKKDLGRIIYIKPRKHIRNLVLSFYLPKHDKDYRTKSASYIAHILGYEAQGSLTAYLRNLGWINTLVVGSGIQGSNYNEFSISMSLSLKGRSCIPQILDAFFYYIKLIMKKGVNAWRYKEKMSVLENSFLYQEAKEPIDNVSQLATNMHHVQIEDLLYANYMMCDYRPQEIKNILKQLTPDNMQLMIIMHGGFYNKNAHWYDTPYESAIIPPELLQRWRCPQSIAALTLPHKNPYIAQHTAPMKLTSTQWSTPTLLENTSGFRLWFAQDQKQQTPKGVIYLSIASVEATNCVRNIVLLRLVIALFIDLINDDTYPAKMAGINHHIYEHQSGLTLKIFGFTTKLPLLLNLILNKIKQSSYRQERFDIIKNQIIRNWENSIKERPILQLYNQLTGIIQPQHPPYLSQLNAIKSIQLSDIGPFIRQVQQNNSLEVFIYGNWDQYQARSFAEKIKYTLRHTGQVHQERQPPLLLLKNKGEIHYQCSCKQSDSAVIIYYQCPIINPTNIALYLLASQLISAPFYADLRTEKQLGYMLGCQNITLNQRPGLVFFIQSPVTAPKNLVKAIDTFITHLPSLLKKITAEELEETKKGLISQILTQEPKMMRRAQYFWSAIRVKDWDFNRDNNIVSAIKKLTSEHIIDFVMAHIITQKQQRLILTSPSKKDTSENYYHTDHNFTSISATQNFLKN